MSKELDLQTKIRKSVKADGGYSHKLTNRFTVGIPDLLMALFPFVPAIIEVKDLGVVVDKFNLKVDVTPKQSHELIGISEVYGKGQHPYTPKRRASGVFVGIVHRGVHRLVALHVPLVSPSDAVWRLDHTYDSDASCYVERGVGGYYNVRPLLEFCGICNIASM